MSNDINPFIINISAAEIQVLKSRLNATRWPDEVVNSGWEYGANLAYIQELVSYWTDQYDWKKEEVSLNQLHHFTTDIEGQTIHFIYEKGKGKTSTPVVLLHGWPSSFVQMLKIIPLLQTPDANGHSFDVIVPSLVGYGFSEPSVQKHMNVYKMASLFHQLLTVKLGYQTFMLRGSDLGAGVAKEWALAYPEAVMGLHLSGSTPYIYQMPENLSDAEKAFTQRAQGFMMAEGAYASEQSTKPQTLAFALTDSPVGLAAWIIEKFNSWSDNGGKLENSFSKDELLTNISLYWFTRSIGPSMRLYYESVHAPSPNVTKQVQIPTAFLMLKNDIAVAPKEWEARLYTNIIHWQEEQSGGHFAEWEKPQVVANDIAAFRKQLK